MNKKKLIIKLALVVSLIVFSQATLAAEETGYSNSNLENHSSSSKESLQEGKCQPLSYLSGQHLSPGIYESDDMELFLSHALENFGPEDAVIFDVDDVLITQRLNPFDLVHVQKKTPLFERFDSLERHSKDKLLHHLITSSSPEVVSIMDEQIPKLIRELQEKGIKCIGNTASYPICGPINSAAARLKLLGELGISFSCTFPSLESWDFDVLHEDHTIKDMPYFQQGMIFSCATPKHITQHELFKKAETIPRRMMFIDDNTENIFGMHNFMTSLGIECYSLCYLKKISKPLFSYFSAEVYDRELKSLESFIENLLFSEGL